MKCREIIEILETLAPKSCACDWDNPGLLAGRIDKDVKKILLTLDADDAAVERAKEIGADLALFGHTHKLFYDKHNGLAMMNPGSIGAPLWGCMPSYGIITFDKEHDVMKLDVDYIEY